MSRHFRLGTLGWLFTIAVTGPEAFGSAERRQETPAAMIVQARRLIEDNCGDCRGAQKENLEKGLALLRTALGASGVDRAAALVVLADGLNTLRFVFAAPDSAEQRAASSEQAAALADLVKLRPQDPDAAYLYASNLTSPDTKLEAYRRVLWLVPTHAGAHFGMGMTFQQQGRTADAIVGLRLALEYCKPGEAEDYARELITLLEQAGRRADISTVRAVVKKKSR